MYSENSSNVNQQGQKLMSDLKLCSSISKKLIACVLLAIPLLLSVNAQDKPEAVAKEAVNQSTATRCFARLMPAQHVVNDMAGDLRIFQH